MKIMLFVKKNCLLFFLSVSLSAGVNVIPQPNFVKESSGSFKIDCNTVIVAAPEQMKLANQLDQFLSPALGCRLKTEGMPCRNSINFKIIDSNELGSEGYILTVTADEIHIQANTDAGLFYGIQTLRQLLPVYIFNREKITGINWQVPCVEIRDEPRFAWRGLHLDVSRHFMSIDFLKKYIDLMAIHKLNRFHLHLTDDTGWRIEIKKYPKLTEIGAWRDKTLISDWRDPNQVWENKRHGGYYTHEQIRELVQYARERFVEIIPEIEMPGHSAAAVRAYPWLSCTGKGREYCPGSEEVFKFHEDVLSEVMDLFPSQFIHIGGDEVKKKGWRICDKCKARMIAEDIADINGLQPYFTSRIEKFIIEKGRRMVGWDEVLEGDLNSQTVVMCWRDANYAVRAVDKGCDVIMTPNSHCYFDFYQGDKKTEPLAFGIFLPLEKVYSYNPVSAELTPQHQKHILGVQACLWTEYVRTSQHAEYMAYPRGCALAEIAWTTLEKKNYDDFLGRLYEHLKRLDNYGVNYRRLDK